MAPSAMIDPLIYFWLLLKASLFSTGGSGNLPSLHADLLTRGWATERQFAESLAIGQLSPGPTGLWVISLGYLTDGLRGALLATLAISLPPFVVLAVDRLHRRVGDHPAVQGFVRGLGLAVVGIFLVVLAQLLAGNGIDGRSLLLMLASAGLALTRRVPVPALLGLAVVAGALLY
jgi:chromate transporter